MNFPIPYEFGVEEFKVEKCGVEKSGVKVWC
jgi:hypothetical protein